MNEQRKCFHYTNLLPPWAADNIGLGARYCDLTVGQTDAPAEIEKYTLLHVVGDMVGVLDALGAETAAIAGHDWGAPVAWHAAQMRPDLFRGVIGLSVPSRPRGASPPTAKMPQNDEALFYQLYFQAPGVAEAELERVRRPQPAHGRGERGPVRRQRPLRQQRH